MWSLLNQMVPIVLKEELQAAHMAMDGAQHSEDAPKNNKETVVAQLEQYTGNYFNPVEGYTREIIFKNDTLQYVRTNGVGTPLQALGDDSFQFLGMPHVKLNFNLRSTPKQLLLQINDEAPISLNLYTPASYTNDEIKSFEGTYYSEELDVYYQIKTAKDKLSVHLEEKELVRLHPVMENVFNDVHFGYLKFEKDDQNRIQGFSINDELVKDIYFEKRP